MSSEKSTDDGKPVPITVKVSREIPMPWFKLDIVENGYTEELDPDECREWFKSRGASMDAVERALDYVWNFGNYKPVYVKITNPIEASLSTDGVSPQV